MTTENENSGLGPADCVSIGIVVPCFNAEAFIRECLDSLIWQDYPNLEILVMDGNSTDSTIQTARLVDGSVAIVSETDNGQADAIEKGFSILKTQLVGWLNADDRLLPGALHRIARAYRESPDGVIFHGDVERVDVEGRLIAKSTSIALTHENVRRCLAPIVQPGSVYSRTAMAKAGNVDPKYHLLMDRDLWIRLVDQGPSVRIQASLAQFRVHAGAKSSQPPYRYYRESARIAYQYDRDHPMRASLDLAKRIFKGQVHHLREKLFASASRSSFSKSLPTLGKPTRKSLLTIAVAAANSSPELSLVATAVADVVLVDYRDKATAIVQKGQSVILILAHPVPISGLIPFEVSFVLAVPEMLGSLENGPFQAYRIGSLERDEDIQRSIAVCLGDIRALFGRGLYL